MRNILHGHTSMMKSLAAILLLLHLCFQQVPAADQPVGVRKGPCHEEHAKISKLLNSSPPVVGATLPDCEDDGSFKPIQCSGAMCYCASPAGKVIPDTSVGIWEIEKIEKLDCPKLQTREIKGPCHEEHAEITEHLNKFPNTVGATLPECEEDGTYKPVQCKGSQCYCVKPNGEELLGASVGVWERQKLDCSKLQIREIKGPCHEEHAKITEHLNKFPNTVGATLPECEEDGTYKPVQCKGSQCYCVKPNGKMVPGASVGVWERQKLDCSKLQTREIKGPCHEEHAKITEHLNKFPNTVGATLPECEENGTYKPVQCKGSQCYCVKPNGEKLLGASVGVWERQKLDCSKQQIREIKGSCHEEHAKITEHLNKYPNTVGATLPECEEDGTYKPVQCRGSQCYCVKPNGEKLLGASVGVWERQKLDCSKLQTREIKGPCHEEHAKITEHLNKNPNTVGATLPECEEDGTYKPVQCKGSQCYCVKPNGKMVIGASVGVWERQKLDCSKLQTREFKGPCHEEHAKITEHLNKYPNTVGATLPECEEDGTYKPVQCKGSQCYCVKPNGKMVLGASVGVWERQKLDCSKLQTREIKGPCHEEHAKITEHLNKNPNTVGATLPKCEEDGTYKPVQCKGSQCFCVTADGMRILKYALPIWASREMDCECARTVAELNGKSPEGDKIPAEVLCDSKGSFVIE